MHAIKTALRSGHNNNMSEFGSVGIGRSTANQRIEMIWCILALRSPDIQFGRDIFLSLVHNKMWNTYPIHLNCIRVCFLPVVQKHLNILKNGNHHKMRSNTRYESLQEFQLTCTICLCCMEEPMPYRGCSGQFRVLIKPFSGITRGDLYVIETLDDTRAVDAV